MYRDLLGHLGEWKDHPLRKPLILRGARQVGKSWLVREFGKTFESYVEINCDKDKGVRTLFAGDLHIPTLLERLSLYGGKKIVAGQTLLFLDEIQECPDALAALRYFKEECPELHVVAAGSLLDFVLEDIGLPVGRVQFLYLYPLSFGEFLHASGRDDLRQHVRTGHVDPAVHPLCLDLLRTYLWLGGMPAVVHAWLTEKDAALCQELQDEILTAFKQDFGKYARARQIEHVTQIFESVPTQLGKKFTFAHVDSAARAEALRRALMLLERAGIVTRIYHSTGQGIPLGATKNEKRFKVSFFDVGLAQRLLGLDLKSWVVQPFRVVNLGAITEQFVAQEVLAYSSPKVKTELFYWHRESPSSNAEVDLLLVKGGKVIPVEIKSGTKGGLKSMRMFLSCHPASPYGLKISEGPFATHDVLHEIPLYGIESWFVETASS